MQESSSRAKVSQCSAVFDLQQQWEPEDTVWHGWCSRYKAQKREFEPPHSVHIEHAQLICMQS